tara:strand:- start:378 stop:677 length:300 start_codon:yes stop_codon:yes gene_type:complete
VRITNLKTVYLTEKEIKEALTCWMRIKNPFAYNAVVEHLKENKCTYDWEMRNGEFLFVISVEGEIDERPPHLDTALQRKETQLGEFEDVIELYKTYGGD